MNKVFACLCTATLIGELSAFAATPALRPDVRFADPISCVECHFDACNDWEKSAHRRSMDHANDKTVLGDFSNVRFIHIGFDDLFYSPSQKNCNISLV